MQNLSKNICFGASFSIKFQAPDLHFKWKKLWHKLLPVNFANFRRAFLGNTCKWLLLHLLLLLCKYYLFKAVIVTLEKVGNVFQVTNKNTRKTSLTSFWLLYIVKITLLTCYFLVTIFIVIQIQCWNDKNRILYEIFIALEINISCRFYSNILFILFHSCTETQCIFNNWGDIDRQVMWLETWCNRIS